MSEVEDDEELPPISVNPTQSVLSGWSMPSAETLAKERARAAAVEHALRQLRLQHRHTHTQVEMEEGGGATAEVAHPDWSVPEDELAPAVPAASDLVAMTALLAHVPDAGGDTCLLAACIRVPVAADRVLDELASMALADAGQWADKEVVSAAAWLAGACVLGARPAHFRRRAARTLHLLVEDVATDHQAALVGEMLVTAAATMEPRAALELSDLMRGGGVRGEALALQVARRALAALSDLAGQEDSVEAVAAALPGAWRRLAAAQRYVALQLLARMLVTLAGTPTRRLLAALTAASPSVHNQSADSLKVLTAATKLQLLFHVGQ